MLWLCLQFPQLPLEAIGGHPEKHWVAGRHGPHQWAITTCGVVTPGMAVGAARLQAPETLGVPRQAQAEQTLLASRAAMAYGIGSPVVAEILGPAEAYAVPQACVWVEIGASQRLFGGLEPLRDRLCEQLIDAEITTRIGLAPSRAAAALLAQVGDTHPCLYPDDLPARLATLPIAALPWPLAWREPLQGIGVDTLGALRQLPREGLLRRLGPTCLRALDQLYGRAPEPFRAVTPPSQFNVRLELLEEIAHVETLLFPLQRLLGELVGFLAAHDLSLIKLRLELELAWDQCPAVDLHLLAPARTRERLLTPLRERLMQAPPPAPVRALRLIAVECGQPRPDQADAFIVSRQGQDWTATLDRLRARLGKDAVWTPVVRDDHRPVLAHDRGAPGGADAAPPAAERPLWWQPDPVLLPQCPQRSGIERLTGGWWSDTPLDADYGWADIDGRRAWIRRDLSGDPLGDRAWIDGWAG
ncbi:Y-family DNA polymerase [Polycyclovorans algicola]|uniref:Y-family DNA polymerase n=1 Tax=Polycyclovorans algicola TaxID=616992 RepID=UPI0004A77D3C|nr:DNA polymerase Y family protein [Polycyclovorans algicola]